MIKRIALIILTLLLFLAPSLQLRVTAKQADSDITVIASDVEIDFPSQTVFTVEAESRADIVDVRLYYQVDKMNYVEVVSEVWADFSPANKVVARWIWDMRQASLPSGAEVTYWWGVEDADKNKLKTAPQIMHFADDRFSWRSLTSITPQGSKLTLFWYEGGDSFAQELMNACEEGLARLTEDIGTYPEKPIKMYIYASTSDLHGAMIFPHEWTGGVAFTEFGTIAIGIAPGRLEWGKRALVHELTHLVVHQATFSPYGQLPLWLDEGLAMYNEGDLEPRFRTRLEEAIQKDQLISVRSLCSPFSAEPEKAYLSYAQSYSIVEYLLDNYGQNRVLDLLTLLKEGATYDEALTEVYGFDIEGLDANWQATLTSQTAIASEARQSQPAVIAISAALVTILVLWGARVVARRTRRRSPG